MMKTRGLYIHIPFCVKKCDYCDFLSFPIRSENGNICISEALIGQYIQALIHEMKMVSADKIDTIFIGGGTPSVLTPQQMNRVFEGIFDSFVVSENCEFTIECNPGTVTREKLSLYRQAGANRISLGMQSAIGRELKQLGRIHSAADFFDSYDLIRNLGFENVNIDVMFSIPEQTKEK